jgi:hypothetical protein
MKLELRFGLRVGFGVRVRIGLRIRVGVKLELERGLCWSWSLVLG